MPPRKFARLAKLVDRASVMIAKHHNRADKRHVLTGRIWRTVTNKRRCADMHNARFEQMFQRERKARAAQTERLAKKGWVAIPPALMPQQGAT